MCLPLVSYLCRPHCNSTQTFSAVICVSCCDGSATGVKAMAIAVVGFRPL